MNELTGILGKDNVNHIKAYLEQRYEEQGPELRGDFMSTGYIVELEDKLPEPVLGWFDTVFLDINTITISALGKHKFDREGYPTENEIKDAFYIGIGSNIGTHSNGEQTLQVSFNLGDRTILEVLGIGE